MAAELVAAFTIAAAAACVSFGSNAVVQPAAVAVVNCACVFALLPLLQLVRTLQSYNEAAVKPARFALVVVCAVEKLVQVPELFSL